VSDIDPETTMSHPGETERERLNRNFHELLQELRVAQTGVQILFAFLLTMAFAARFHEISDFDRIVYVITLMATACATALLIAPVSYHRLVFRRGMKERLVRDAHLLAQGGLAFLLLAMVGSVMLAVDVVVGIRAGLIISGVVALWFIVFWYLIPALNRPATIQDAVGPQEQKGAVSQAKRVGESQE